MGFVSTLATQIVITGVLIGVARRVGLITVNPRVLKGDTTRKAFEVYVSTGDYIVEKAESLVRSGAKAIK